MFSQMKDRKHIEQNFHSVSGVMPKGWDMGGGGAGWVKKISEGIWDGAPSTVHSSFKLIFHIHLSGTLLD